MRPTNRHNTMVAGNVALFLLFFAVPGVLKAQDAGAKLEGECEVSSVKPVDPAIPSPLGVRVYAGGRITVGRATLRTLIELAYSVEQFQISGGPDWINKDNFDVILLCPSTSKGTFVPSSGYSYNLTSEQRRILSDLLSARFRLKLSRSVVNGRGLLLLKGSGPTMMSPTTKPDREPAMSVMQKGQIVDGEAFGINASMNDVAKEFQTDLQQTVVDRTGIEGSYDFHTMPFDRENKDLEYAVSGVAKKLGLELRKGIVPRDVIIIEHASKPDEN